MAVERTELSKVAQQKLRGLMSTMPYGGGIMLDMHLRPGDEICVEDVVEFFKLVALRIDHAQQEHQQIKSELAQLSMTRAVLRNFLGYDELLAQLAPLRKGEGSK